MCRLSAYKGNPVLLGDLIVKPENSLVCQSRDAGYHPGVVDDSNRRNIRVNGDGVGVAFYGEDVSLGSCLFKVVTPAWSNKNLISIGQHIYSSLIFGHIRAATNDKQIFEPNSVSTENCHPFSYGKWTFMHNGGIPHFSKIKLSLLNLLQDEYFQMISGSTDSEHIFALFMSLLPKNEADRNIDSIASTINKTIATIIQLCHKAEIKDACSLNICITDGINMFATRFRNSKCSPPSLYYNYGINFCSSSGSFTEPGTLDTCGIVISSAPLGRQNFCDSYDPCNENHSPDFGTWLLVPKNSMLIVVGSSKDISKVSQILIRPIESNNNDISIIYNENISTSTTTTKSNPCEAIITQYQSECVPKQIYPNRNCTPPTSVHSSPYISKKEFSTSPRLDSLVPTILFPSLSPSTYLHSNKTKITKQDKVIEMESYDIRINKSTSSSRLNIKYDTIINLLKDNIWNVIFLGLLLYIAFLSRQQQQ